MEVRCERVHGQWAVVTQALESVTFVFSIVNLALAKLLQTTLGESVEVAEVVSVFDEVVAKADCLF